MTVYWMQNGGCGGDTFSLLNVESPDLAELIDLGGLDILFHPSLSDLTPREHIELVDAMIAGEQELDVLCLEGSVIRGPGGTGMFDTWNGRPKKDIVWELAQRAKYVLAVGTCAAYGGVTAVGETESTGIQFHREKLGGFLGANFRTHAGNPVINLPGCPCHGEALLGTLGHISAGDVPSLNEFNAPKEWFGLLVHQGCVRGEYHEYRVEEREFGERGCLFFFLGCRGPMAYGPCNKLLWNRRNTKTRVGMPCFGCTEPTFPQETPFFETQAIAGVPIELPVGVDRAHYLAYKDMAAAAAPSRLKSRRTRV
jgi:hydrogenase small subunit